MVLLLAKKNTMMTNRQLAERSSGIDDSAVAQAVRRLSKRIREDASLGRLFAGLQKKLE
jgi:hypothetical protein